MRSTAVPLYVPGARIPATLMPTFGCVSKRFSLVDSKTDGEMKDLQLPMTAVLTTSVKRVFWFAAVLFLRRAVV